MSILVTMREQEATTTKGDTMHHPLFNQLHRVGKDEFNERNDCTVKALSVVADLTYGDAHAILKKCGRPNRNGPTWFNFWRAVRKAGLNKVDVTKKFKAKTIMTLTREMAGTKGRYLVETRGHVVSVLNGEVIDFTANRRHRVVSIYKITGDNENFGKF